MAAKWWDDMSPLQKAEYFIEHPKSKMPKDMGRAISIKTPDDEVKEAKRREAVLVQKEIRRIMEEGEFSVDWINARFPKPVLTVLDGGIIAFDGVTDDASLKLRIKNLENQLRHRPEGQKLVEAAKKKAVKMQNDVAEKKGLKDSNNLPPSLKLVFYAIGLVLVSAFVYSFLKQVDPSIVMLKGGLLGFSCMGAKMVFKGLGLVA
jgi:hypothetical protein